MLVEWHPGCPILVPFRIDPRTGAIRTTRKLDSEDQSTYQIPVAIHDSGLPPMYANTTVVVEVEDINDNPPQFSEELYEGEVEEVANGAVQEGQRVLLVSLFIRNQFEHILFRIFRIQ